MRHASEAGFKWENTVALIILAGAYIAAVLWVHVVNRVPDEKGPEGRKIVRMAHSVADKNVQNAFEQLAHAYEKIRPDVEIIVQAIPRRAYLQWEHSRQTMERGKFGFQSYPHNGFYGICPDIARVLE